jgi:hypothetical protein
MGAGLLRLVVPKRKLQGRIDQPPGSLRFALVKPGKPRFLDRVSNRICTSKIFIRRAARFKAIMGIDSSASGKDTTGSKDS